MSKRGAGNYLTDQNWDEEDDSEEAGEFTQASKDVLQARQIKKAKRRAMPDSGLPASDSGGVFKGFTGFVSSSSSSEPARPMFSFGGGPAKPLFGLINGPSSRSSYTSTTYTGCSNSGSKFSTSSMHSTSSTATMSTAGCWSPKPKPATETVSVANETMAATTETPVAKETPATRETPAAKEIPAATTETPAAKETAATTETPTATETPMATTEAEAPAPTPPVISGPGLSNGSGGKAPSATRAKYLQQLKSLNEGVAKWVQEHVAKNPYCILSPIFKDYEKHLAGIEAKFPSQEEEKAPAAADKAAAEEAKGDGSKATGSDTPTKPESPSTKAPESAAPAAAAAAAASPPSRASLFTFGASAMGGAASKGFGAGPLGGTGPLGGSGPLGGAGSKPLGSGPLGGGASSTFGSGGGIFGAGLSSGSVFGGIKPLGSTSGFSFAASKPKEASDSTGAAATGGDDEYVPPKPEVTAVKEDDAFYTKRCKLFFQKDEQWKEKGVGNLFLKPCKDKTQLLIRADTSLGNILLNIMLAPSLPLSRQGKNNVTLVCVPNPPMDEKNPDDKTMVPMLIRVKTAEDADELLEKLKENKE